MESKERGTIERGKILTAENGEYTIASLDRDGIITPPMKPVDEKTYSVGDMVYFFYFKDGTGRVICSL